MAKLCNAAPAFFRAQPGGMERNFTQPIVTRRLQSLLCCAACASFRLKSATIGVVGAKQVLTGLDTSQSGYFSRVAILAIGILPATFYAENRLKGSNPEGWGMLSGIHHAVFGGVPPSIEFFRK
jgi:hypothetical protein